MAAPGKAPDVYDSLRQDFTRGVSLTMQTKEAAMAKVIRSESDGEE